MPVKEVMNPDIIAIGGSAGSLETLREIVFHLPRGFTGNVFLVVHIGHSRSRLAELLAIATSLPVSFARDGEPIEPGHIYVAPSDRHLLVAPGLLRLSCGPHEHFTRPAIDPLFRSVATAYGERVIGVVLSGGGSDGAAGLDTIKRAGGIAIVLDPQDAGVADMPQAAAEVVSPDFIAAKADLPSLLVRLSRESISATRPQPPSLLPEPIEMPEQPLALTCPECGGTLRKSGNGAGAQYRCHIGHIFGAGELLPAQLELIEKAFDVVQRVLNGRIELSRQMVEDSRAAGRSYGQRYWERVHAEAEQQADAIRRIRPELTGNGQKLQEVFE
jgi:two-component system, chemotaxis family, protein-glutamate methylesterase/glutaminase